MASSDVDAGLDGVSLPDGVDVRRRAMSANTTFFTKPVRDARERQLDVAAPSMRGGALRAAAGSRAGARSGPATRCGKKETKSTKSRKLSRRALAAIDVDRVAERLERVERDADRQHDVRTARGSAQRTERSAATFVGDEVAVLEVAEHAEVERDARRRRSGAARRRPSPALEREARA